MNHEQEPVTGTSDSHKRLSRLTTVALVLALVGTLLGSAFMLIGLWSRVDEVTTTTAQANVANPSDAGARAKR